MAERLDPQVRRLLDDADFLLKRSAELQAQAAVLSRHLAQLLRRQPVPRRLGDATWSEGCAVDSFESTRR